MESETQETSNPQLERNRIEIPRPASRKRQNMTYSSIDIEGIPLHMRLLEILQKIKDWKGWTFIGVCTYNVSKILLTLGLSVLAGFYAFAVTSAMPVLFGGGIVLSVVFGFYAISNIITLYKIPQDNKNTKFKPLYYRSAGTGILGVALIALGVLLLVAPPFMGALFGVGLAVKIGLISVGALFAAKGILNGITKIRQAKGKLARILSILPDYFLDIAPLLLGVSVIVAGISGIAIPWLATIMVIFAMRFASHVLRALSKPTKTEKKEEIEEGAVPIISKDEEETSRTVIQMQKDDLDENKNKDDDKLNSQNKCMTAARVLDNLSLMGIGSGLIVAGALFAAPLAAAIGIPVLFAQIPLLVIGSLFALMGLTKFFIGPMIESLENDINSIISGMEIHERKEQNLDDYNRIDTNNLELSANNQVISDTMESQ